MTDLLEKYRLKAQVLREQGKTGYECEWCGRRETVKTITAFFCAGCGHEDNKHVWLTVFGIPVFDDSDAAELLPLAYRQMYYVTPR